ncbi:MAG: tyrosine-type recombinase/integrase [Clostridiales bacterium]|nr:tyrosine-type recombinase/integrase [Clostridiales bacterium]
MCCDVDDNTGEFIYFVGCSVTNPDDMKNILPEMVTYEISGLSQYIMCSKKACIKDLHSAVANALGIRFDTGFVLSRPVEGLTNKTIKHRHRLISSILNQAVFWQVITDNPATRVRPPRVERTEAKFLDEKQAAKLLEYLDNESWQNSTMIKVFIYSGLRRGEMCGLEWSDIDFENHLITIRRSSQYVPGKGRRQKLKPPTGP